MGSLLGVVSTVGVGSNDVCSCAKVIGPSMLIEPVEPVESVTSEEESWVDAAENEVVVGVGEGGVMAVWNAGFGDVTFTKSKRKVEPLARLVIVSVWTPGLRTGDS